MVLLPRLWQRVSTPETNADWLRLRQSELIEEAPQLREEAALRLIEEGGVSEPTLAGPRAVYSGPGQLLGVLGLTIGVWLLYWQLGSWEDVQIARGAWAYRAVGARGGAGADQTDHGAS